MSSSVSSTVLSAGCRAAQHVMYLSSSQEDSKTHARMLRHLVTKIKSTGPISVAEYMREVLTNPVTVNHPHLHHSMCAVNAARTFILVFKVYHVF